MKPSHLLALSLTVLALVACQNADSPPVHDTSEITAPAINIQSVSLTPEDEAALSERLRIAGEIDQFKDPTGYIDAHREVLDFAETLYPAPHPKLEDIKQEIAFGEFVRGNLNEALGIVERSLPIYVAAGPDYADKRIELYNNLGVANTQMGQVDKAITFLEKAVEEWRVKFGTQPNIDLASGLDNLAGVYHLAGNQTDKVLALNNDAADMLNELPESVERNRKLVTSLGNRSKYLGETFRFEESLINSLSLIARLDELLEPNDPHGAYVLSSVASTLIQLKQYKSAERNARKAVELREAAMGPEAAETAVARNVLVNALISQGRHQDALPLARFNFDILSRSQGPAAEQTLAAAEYLNRSLFALGQRDDALAQQKIALARLEAEDRTNGYEYQDAVRTYADMHLLAEDYSQAQDFITKIKGKIDLSNNPSVAHSLTLTDFLVDAHLNPDTPASEAVKAAQKWYDEKLIAGMIRSSRSGLRDASVNHAYGRILSAAFKRQDTELAFEMMQKINHGSLSNARSQQFLRRQFTGSSEQKALQTLQALHEKRGQVLREAYILASKGNSSDVRDMSSEISTIDDDISQISETLKAKLKTVSGLNFDTVQDIQKSINDDTLLLIQSETPYGAYVFALTSESQHIRRIDLGLFGRTIRKVSETLKAPLLKEIDNRLFSSLGDAVFDETILNMMASKSHIAVYANGWAAQIPLSVARYEKEDRDVWVADTHSLTYLSSLSDIKEPDNKPLKSIDHFVGIGFASSGNEAVAAASTPQYAFRSAQDIQTLRELPALPNAAAELKAISASLSPKKSDILVTSNFSEKDVRAIDLSSADVIAFATHGLMADEFENIHEAALIISSSSDMTIPLNDGLLTSSEIADLTLSAQWVILSACNTGTGNSENTDAFSGLAAAFTQAGAQSLLVSHWPVRDDAAAFLTDRTIKNSQAGMSKAKALQMAVKDIRENSDIPNAKHPSIWAPFVLVGQP